MATDELASCLSQLSAAIQRNNDSTLRKKTEIQKPTGTGEHREFFSGSEESQDSECTTRESIPEVVEQPPALSNSEHAYSSFSKGEVERPIV